MVGRTKCLCLSFAVCFETRDSAKMTKEPVAGDSERRAPCGGGLSWGHPTKPQSDDATIVAVLTGISRGVEKFFWTPRQNGRNTEHNFNQRLSTRRCCGLQPLQDRLHV